MKENQIKSILFTGGEPTLFPWLDDILKYSKKHGFNNILITNAFLDLTKILPYLDSVILSLDGSKSAHTLLRENVESYDRVIFNLNKISEYKKKGNNLECIINTVVTSSNLSLIESSYKELLSKEFFKNAVNKVKLSKVSNEGKVLEHQELLVPETYQKFIRDIADRLTELSNYKIIFETNLFYKEEFFINFPSSYNFIMPVWVDFTLNSIYVDKKDIIYEIDGFKRWDNKIFESFEKIYYKIIKNIEDKEIFDPYEIMNVS